MVELKTLGGVEIRVDQNIVTLRSRKHVGLLLRLAAGGQRVHARSRLCDLLWGSNGSRARHSLSQALYDITKRVGPVLSRGSGEDVLIDYHRIAFDVREFESAIRSDNLRAAVAIYQGPFAGNLVDVGTREFEQWLESERSRLARLGEIVLRKYVETCESEGHWGEMCVAASQLVKLAPLDENAHRTLMRALWLQGDSISPIRHFESVAPVLGEELPEGISAETKALVRRIRSEPKPTLPSSQEPEEAPTFIGREREFEQLRRIVSASNGSHVNVVVAGEAGIGKSRLLRELHHSLRIEPIRVLSSRCYQAEEDLAYAPIIEGMTPLVDEMMRAEPRLRNRFQRLKYLFPSLGSRPPGDDERAGFNAAAWRRLLYEEVSSLLRVATERGPIVWLVDDVQWVDRASHGLMHYLSRRLSDRRFLMVMTVRTLRGSVELTSLPIPHIFSDERRTFVLRLSPLSNDQIRQIARASGSKHPAIDLAVRLSAGNPSYALAVLEAAVTSSEWADSATDWNPLNDDRIRQVFEIRLTDLEDGPMRILQSVAVLERHARPQSIAKVAGLSLEAAAEAAADLYARSLLIDDDGRISFASDAMREYVYGQLSAIESAALHLKAGQVLRGEGDVSSGALATHFYYGDDWSQSFRYAMEAARAAQNAAGHVEAAHFAEIASKTAPKPNERRVALEMRANSLLVAGQLSKAAACYEKILLSGASSPATVADMYLRLSATEIEKCDWEGAAEALHACSEVLPSVPSPDRRLFLQSEHSMLKLKLAVRTDDEVSAKGATSAIDAALREVDAIRSASGQTKLSILLAKAVQLGLDGASASALRYLANGEEFVATAPRHVTRYYTYRGIVKAWLADWDGATADFNHSRVLAERQADKVGITTQWSNLACIALERGDWGLAEDCLRSAASVQDGLGENQDTQLALALNQADLLFYQGYTAQAEQAYTTAANLCDQQESLDRLSEVYSCLGLIALQQRNRDLAVRYWEMMEQAGTPTPYGVGTRERFKAVWFSAAMEPRLLDSRHLLEAAEHERERDRPSCLKLLWLQALLTQEDTDEVRAQLKKNNLTWFCHVSSRWARAAGMIV